MPAEDSQERNYRCPTCFSVAVDVTEYEGGERVHIYCQEPACRWVHRALFANGSIVNSAKEWTENGAGFEDRDNDLAAGRGYDEY